MHYVLLGLAISSEVVASILIKYSDGFRNVPIGLASYFFYGISFFFFAKCLDGIKVGIAYATWASLGIVAITLFSVLILHDSLSAFAIAGLVLIIIGTIMLYLF